MKDNDLDSPKEKDSADEEEQNKDMLSDCTTSSAQLKPPVPGGKNIGDIFSTQSNYIPGLDLESPEKEDPSELNVKNNEYSGSAKKCRK